MVVPVLFAALLLLDLLLTASGDKIIRERDIMSLPLSSEISAVTTISMPVRKRRQ
jgi:hypothetical protein